MLIELSLLIFVVFVVLLLVILFTLIPVGLWISALAAGVKWV